MDESSKTKIAAVVAASAVVGGVALSRYVVRKQAKKIKARIEMYDRWVDAIEHLDPEAENAEDDLEFWSIIVENEINS